MLATQYTHVLKIHGTDDSQSEFDYQDLHVTHFDVQQKLSACYRVVLDVTTRWMQVPTSLIGKRASFTWQRGSASQTMRGVVDTVEMLGAGKGVLQVRITLVPRLFMATRDRRDRVFNDINAYELICDVLDQLLMPFGDAYQFKSEVAFQKREICIQYQESTFDFLMRILAEEGLHITFDHSDEHEVIVIGSSNNVFQNAAQLPLVYRSHAGTDEAHVSQVRSKTQTPGPAAQVSYVDWRGDNASRLLGTQPHPKQSQTSDDFVYVTHHTPHGYDPNDDAIVQHLRLNHEIRATSEGESISGETNCLTLAAGTYFQLAQHPESALEQVYLVTSCVHTGRSSEVPYAPDDGAQQEPYGNVFEAIPFDRPYRTPLAPRNHMATLHTGLVVAPPGEDVDTDEYGRIRVLFCWDRESEIRGEASAWLRYNQVFAGSDHGLMAIPRAGTEVLIGFINGHIDHPVVLGSVYGQRQGQTQPYDPQRHKSRTTLRTYTTPRQSEHEEYNELTFEDTKGQQCIALHAANDYASRVKGRHIEIVASDAAFKPLASKESRLGRLAGSIDELTPEVLLHPKHDAFKDNVMESYIEKAGDPIVDAAHTLRDDTPKGLIRNPYTNFIKLIQAKVPFVQEGQDRLLLTENLYHVLGKLALQTVLNHGRDSVTRSAVALRKKYIKPDPDRLIARLGGDGLFFTYAKKFEEETRKVFETYVKNGSVGEAPSKKRLLVNWFSSIIMPGSASLWRRLSFTDGGILDVTTSDRRQVTFKKRIEHVGASSSDTVYGERYIQTSKETKEVCVGAVSQQFGSTWKTIANEAVVHEGKKDLFQHYGTKISLSAGEDVEIRAQKKTLLRSDAQTDIVSGAELNVAAHKALKISAEDAMTMAAKTDTSVSAGKHLHLKADEVLTIQQAGTTIVIKGGVVTVKATKVKFDVTNCEIDAKENIKMSASHIRLG